MSKFVFATLNVMISNKTIDDYYMYKALYDIFILRNLISNKIVDDYYIK